MLIVSFTGVRSGSLPSLIAAMSTTSRSGEDEILVNDQPDRRAWPDRDRRLDTEITLGNLIAGPRHIILRRHADRLDEIALARSEEHTSELQSLMRISYAVFCLKKKKTYYKHNTV